MERRFGGYGGGFNRGSQGNFAPVKVGDELDVAIEAVGGKGDGLAKQNGFVLFVPNTKEGDKVRIRITKVLRKVGFAEVIGEATGAPAPEQKKETPADTEDFGEESTEETPEEATEETPEPSEDIEEAADEEYPEEEKTD